MIQTCRFGKMTIAGRTYNSDLRIYPDQRVRDSWWREDGHRLFLEDISDLIEDNPAVLVVGTGIFGRMRIDGGLEDHLLAKKIEMKSARTKSATQIYNRLLNEGRRVAACFHLTC